jgi:hypothetical protein
MLACLAALALASFGVGIVVGFSTTGAGAIGAGAAGAGCDPPLPPKAPVAESNDAAAPTAVNTVDAEIAPLMVILP